MKELVRYSHGQGIYTGRLHRATFNEWAESPDGHSVVDAVVAGVRFAPFGRWRAARHRVWRELTQASRADVIVAGVQREVRDYLARLNALVYADDLPRADVHLRRLVVVPRLFVNREAFPRIDAVLRGQRSFTTLQGGHVLRCWLSLTIVDRIAAAVAAARPSPHNPLPAGDGWSAVGVNERFPWYVPLEGPAWPGHYYVLEKTRTPVTRAVRKAASEAIARLESSLPSLSRLGRHDILRQAGAWIRQHSIDG